MVACLHRRHDDRQNRTHARRRRNTRLPAFERSQTFLEHRDRRIGKARVGVVILGMLEAFGRLGRAVEAKAGSQKERFRVLVVVGPHRAGAHGERIEIQRVVHVLMPFALGVRRHLKAGCRKNGGQQKARFASAKAGFVCGAVWASDGLSAVFRFSCFGSPRVRKLNSNRR